MWTIQKSWYYLRETTRHRTVNTRYSYFCPNNISIKLASIIHWNTSTMCVVCIRNKSNSFTTYYCGLCTVTSTKGYERNPLKICLFYVYNESVFCQTSFYMLLIQQQLCWCRSTRRGDAMANEINFGCIAGTAPIIGVINNRGKCPINSREYK